MKWLEGKNVRRPQDAELREGTFADFWDRIPGFVELPALAEVGESAFKEAKTAGTYVVPASFSSADRRDENVRSIEALKFDHDSSAARTVRRLKRSGVSCAYHTTASHTAELPKLRSYVELKTPIVREGKETFATFKSRAKAVHRAAAEHLDVVEGLDKQASEVLSQAMFCPQHQRGVRPHSGGVAGEALDWTTLDWKKHLPADSTAQSAAGYGPEGRWAERAKEVPELEWLALARAEAMSWSNDSCSGRYQAVLRFHDLGVPEDLLPVVTRGVPYFDGQWADISQQVRSVYQHGHFKSPFGWKRAEEMQNREIAAWAERVVQRAREAVKTTEAEPGRPDPFAIELVSPKGIVDLAQNIAPLLVPPLVPVGAYVYAAAPTGIGKSWFGYSVAQKARQLGVPLIYVDAEDKAFDLKWRMLQTGLGTDEGGWIWHHPNLRLDDDRWVDALIARMKTDGIKLLILDPLRRLHRADENSANDDGGMGHVLRSIWLIIKETGATVFVIHHTRADGEKGRGSTIIQDDADVSMLLSERLPRKRGVKSIRIELVKDKLIPTAPREWHFTATTIGTPQTPEARTTFNLAPVVEDADSVKDVKLADEIVDFVWKRRNDGGVTRSVIQGKKDAGGLGRKKEDVIRVLDRLLGLDEDATPPTLKLEGKKLFCIHPPTLVPFGAKPIRQRTETAEVSS